MKVTTGTPGGRTVAQRYVAEPAPAIRVRARAGTSLANAPPANAFDRNPASIWTPGLAAEPGTQWIEADLGDRYAFGSFELRGLLAGDGPITHELYVCDSPIGEDTSGAKRLTTWSAEDLRGSSFKHDRGADHHSGRYVQVRTRRSPGPVVWREIDIEPLRPSRAAMAADNDPATWWSASKPGAWLEFELLERAAVDRVDLAFGFGKRRRPIEIRLSENGKKWQAVYSGPTAGKAHQYQTFNFPARKARFVRVVLGPVGAGEHDLRHIAEARLFGPYSADVPPADEPLSGMRPGATADGLVGHWPLDGHARDGSGLGHDGALTGAAQWTDGRRGRALDFSPTTRVDLGDVADFAHDRPFTFAAFARYQGEQAMVLLSRSRMGRTYTGYDIGFDGGHLRVRLSHQVGGNAIVVRTRDALPKQRWNHLAVTYDGSSRADGLTLYVDGTAQRYEVQRDNLTESIHVDETALLGTRHDGRQPFGGALDDVWIYNRALSGDRIVTLMQGKGRPGDSAASAPPAAGASPAAGDEDPFFDLIPLAVASKPRAGLKVLEDGSILANAKRKRSRVEVTYYAPRDNLRGFGLEVLPHESLPRKGPGTGSQGMFALGEIGLTAAPADRPDRTESVKLTRVSVDRNDGRHPAKVLIDGRPTPPWIVRGQPGKPRLAALAPDQPVGYPGGTILRLTLQQRINLGRFRLRATEASNALALASADGDGAPLPLYVNFGGDQTLEGGKEWRAAHEMSEDVTWGYSGGSKQQTRRIGNQLFDTAVRGLSAFRADVPEGRYRLLLFFKDVREHRVKQEGFEIAIEGQVVESDLHIELESAKVWRDAGGVFVRKYHLPIKDGRLEILFKKKTAQLNALSLEPLG
ncbi:MAG: hypothetical protein GVY27_04015 [Deinococcus-Thermus bacterium]|nr:hypothetical protein [Deinococcota bacterium]